MNKQKKPKFNIFWKTFLITTAMLMGITFIAFTLIYMLLPGFYQNHKIDIYNERVNDRIVELGEALDLNEEVEILRDIFHGASTPFRLLDGEGAILYQLEMFSSVNATSQTGHMDDIFQSVPFVEEEIDFQGKILPSESEGIWITGGASESGNVSIRADITREFQVLEVENDLAPIIGFSVATFDFEHTFLSLTFDYTTDSGYARVLEVSIPLTPLADAQVVIMSMYPFAVLLSVAFALVASFIFSWWIAKPIKKIQLATSKMRKLEPNVIIATKSQDEIGILSCDISQLYEQLRGTIVTLEQEVSRYSYSENKKIEFLQSVSHEMKTPLASANALLEGIIYEISPYHDNQKKYLEECREFLQKTISLTKESLNLSEQYKKPEALYDLVDIIKETSNLYGVIFMVKQLSYHEDVPENISIRTKKNLFLKVLSNLFSNAANYTSDGGQVRVSFSDGVLTVFNSCKPLTQEQVDEIFKPLMTQNTAEHATGLGLFIVKQLLRQLKIDFTFKSSADKAGMEFKLWIPEVMNN